MYMQALLFAPSIAVGIELLGEGKGFAVSDGAECGAGNTNHAGQEMVPLCLSTSKRCYSCKFSQFVHKTIVWLS